MAKTIVFTLLSSLLPMIVCAQPWKADIELSEGGDGAIFLIILATLFIADAFKKSKSKGFVALIVVGAVAGLGLAIPKLGGIIIVLLLLAIGYSFIPKIWR